ncbi:AP2-like ethylene-responsive transcription factor PLT1 [Carica papaya]|uniref:AP2-like ethylene-responsive transcription factor PLT1 n=1 Tax=Carica papaya TaxID=3649 RepID=UPI000B8CB05D|nr:AP2-like ethylene-responsive transcription factor PLT1 [Carica papaya]
MPFIASIRGFTDEIAAARAYDLAALKLWKNTVPLNFPYSDYNKDLEEMKGLSNDEYFLAIRRNSKGFAKGESNFRGVSRNSDFKKWQARVGKSTILKTLYLGTFETQEEAARAYDIASIRLKGHKAVTNYDLNQYDIHGILRCPRIPIGRGASKKIRTCTVEEILSKRRESERLELTNLEDTIPEDGDQSSNGRPFSGDPELGVSGFGNSFPRECFTMPVHNQISQHYPDSSLSQNHGFSSSQAHQNCPGYGGHDLDIPFFTHGNPNETFGLQKTPNVFLPNSSTTRFDENVIFGNPTKNFDFQNRTFSPGSSSSRVDGNIFSKNPNSTYNEDSSTGAEMNFRRMDIGNLTDKGKSIVRNSPLENSKIEGPIDSDSDDEINFPPCGFDMNSKQLSSSSSNQ